jgi:hypothetical protein
MTVGKLSAAGKASMTDEQPAQYSTYGQHEVGFSERPAVLVVFVAARDNN